MKSWFSKKIVWEFNFWFMYNLIENEEVFIRISIDCYQALERFFRSSQNLRQKCANNVISSLLQQLGLELVFIISAPLGLGKRSLLTNGYTTKDLWSSKGDHFWLKKKKRGWRWLFKRLECPLECFSLFCLTPFQLPSKNDLKCTLIDLKMDINI